MLGPMRAPSKVRTTALVPALSAATLLLAGFLSGCTGEPEERPASAPRRQPTLRALSRPVRAWVEQGFVAGPWPRNGFRAAFAPFAGGTRSAAMRDADLLTLQRSGSSLTEVIPLRRRVKVSVTTHRARVAGQPAAAHRGRVRAQGPGRCAR